MSKMKAKMAQMRPKVATTMAELVKMRPKRARMRPKMSKAKLHRRGGCGYTVVLEDAPYNHLK